jgi:CBS domain-containing protein
MENRRVGEVMIPLEKYPHVTHTATLLQAMEAIENAVLETDGRYSLPRVVLIFNENYQLVGLARRRDILRGLEPDFLLQKPLEYRKKLFDVEIDPNLSELPYDRIIKAAIENGKKPVSEVMKPVEVTVNHDAHIFTAIYEMNSNRVSLLPVLKDNEVVGVVRSVDVFHEVYKLLHESK